MRRDAPVYLAQRGRFRRQKEEESGLLRRHAGLDRPSSARLQTARGFGAGIMASYTHYPPQPEPFVNVFLEEHFLAETGIVCLRQVWPASGSGRRVE